MTVKLTEQKRKNLKALVRQLLTISKPSIRFVARVIGTIVSYFPASKIWSIAHYRDIEKCKSEAL